MKAVRFGLVRFALINIAARLVSHAGAGILRVCERRPAFQLLRDARLTILALACAPPSPDAAPSRRFRRWSIPTARAEQQRCARSPNCCRSCPMGRWILGHLARWRTLVLGWYCVPMDLRIELEREEDGRWIADVAALPGVMAYGSTPADAVARVKALAFRVLADRIEHGEPVLELDRVSFVAA